MVKVVVEDPGAQADLLRPAGCGSQRDQRREVLPEVVRAAQDVEAGGFGRLGSLPDGDGIVSGQLVAEPDWPHEGSLRTRMTSRATTVRRLGQPLSGQQASVTTKDVPEMVGSHWPRAASRLSAWLTGHSPDRDVAGAVRRKWLVAPSGPSVCSSVMPAIAAMRSSSEGHT